MVDHVTCKTVVDVALGAVVVRLVLLLLEEEIVAVLRRALEHVGVLIADLFPFELLASAELLQSQQLSQVWQRDRHLAAGYRAHNGQLLRIDAGLHPLLYALLVVDVGAVADGEDAGAFAIKERHLADLADLIFIFVRLALL